MACKRERRNVTSRTWEHLKFDSKSYVYKNTLERAWRFHLALGLNVEDIVFRKILYDSIYDAIQNRHGKIHWREFLTEYHAFINEYHQYFEIEQVKSKLQEWEEYRNSEAYKNFIEHLKDVKRTDARLKIAINNALAYMHLKYGNNWGERLSTLEKKLKLDIIEKLWSKKAVWFLVDTLVFDASRLYASTEGRDIVYEPQQDAIKVYVKRWYERSDIIDEDFRFLARIYDDILTTIAGEIGSVIIAEKLRKYTVLGLLHLAESAKKYTKAVKTLVGLASFLNGSVLGWLGWQILVEWSFDEEIQKALRALFKYAYYAITKDATIFEVNRLSKDEFENAIKIYIKWLVTGQISEFERLELERFFELATTKQKEVLNRIATKISEARRIYNQKKTLYEELNKEMFRTREIIDRIRQGEREVYKLINNFDIEELSKFVEKTNKLISFAFDAIVNSKVKYVEKRGKEINAIVYGSNYIYVCQPDLDECLYRLMIGLHPHGYVLEDRQFTDEYVYYVEGMYYNEAKLIRNIRVKQGDADLWELLKIAIRYIELNKNENIRVLLEQKLDKLRLRIQKKCVSIIRKRNYRKTRERVYIYDKIKFNREIGIITFHNWYYDYRWYYAHTLEGEDWGWQFAGDRTPRVWDYDIYVSDNEIVGQIGDRRIVIPLRDTHKVKKSKRSKVICYTI